MELPIDPPPKRKWPKICAIKASKAKRGPSNSVGNEIDTPPTIRIEKTMMFGIEIKFPPPTAWLIKTEANKPQ
jgi:hypothetical protein